MSSPKVPVLAPEDEISYPLDLNIHSVIDPIVEHCMDSPVIPPSKASTLQNALHKTLPHHGAPLDEILSELKRVAVDHGRHNAHPGFYGYVASPGLPTDPLGHALTAAINQNVVGYPGAPGATTVERIITGWFKELTGFPEQADGVIVSGGSIGNLAALAAALYTKFGDEAVAKGIVKVKPEKIPVVLASESVHFSIQRAAVVLGLGQDNVLAVNSTDDFRMSPAVLKRTLGELTACGQLPICVVVNVGSTATGAIDPLPEIVEICQQHDVWCHADAAYGGAGLLSKELRSRFAGIEQVDSITMDLHKWFYHAFDGSMLLFRNPDKAKRVFFSQSNYVQFEKHGPPEEHMFFHLSPELSRRARALAPYLAFRYYGVEKLGRNVLHNAQCARYLAELVKANPDLELVSDAQLSICCFRYAPQVLRTNKSKTDKVNNAIRDQLQSEGDFYLSKTNLRGRPVLRVCIVSHTTRAKHIEELVASVLRIGESLTG